MSDLRTITEVAPLVRSGAVSPVALVATCLETARARASLNAFVTLMAEHRYRLINLEGPIPVEEEGASAHALALPPGDPGD